MSTTRNAKLEQILRQAFAFFLFSIAGACITTYAVSPDPDDHRNDALNPLHARSCRFCRESSPRIALEAALAFK